MNRSIVVGQSVYVIVQPKDGASQEECLCYVHEDTACDVLFIDGLIGSEGNAAYDK